jgi:hypothetical protein
MTGNLSELLDLESLDGCPIESKTKKQAIKGRETRLTRKQSVPQYGLQFCYQINRLLDHVVIDANGLID